MTSPTLTDVVHAWFHTLPEDVRRHVNATRALAQHVRDATAAGWTVQQLADEACRGVDKAERVAAFVTHRMHAAAGMPPPRPVTTFATFRQPNPPCGNCDPITRWTNDLPARRCTCWTDPRSAT